MAKTNGWLSLLLVSAVTAIAGCGGDDGASADILPQRGIKPLLFPTDNSMNFLSGYDSNSENIYPVCMGNIVDLVDDTIADPFVNQYDYQMKMVDSKASIYDMLNASYQTETKYLVGKNKVAVDMSNEFKHESKSIYVMVSSTWDGPTFSLKNPAFTQTKINFLKDYPSYPDFVKMCGDSFVQKIQTGVHFHAMFKFTFSSTSDTNTVRARLGNNPFPGVKTAAELNNKMGIDTSSTTVEVTARILGGTADALDISNVTTVEGFFKFVKDYSDKEKDAIKKTTTNTDGSPKVPDKNLLYGYAVGAVVVPYSTIITNQYHFGWSYTDQSDSSGMSSIAKLFAKHRDWYNQLDFIVKNPNLFNSASPGKTLSDQEISDWIEERDRFKASAAAAEDNQGLQVLMELCRDADFNGRIEPAINPPGMKQPITSVLQGTTTTALGFCESLYPSDKTQCKTRGLCQAVWDKLSDTPETERLPFFTDHVIVAQSVTVDGKTVMKESLSSGGKTPTLKALPTLIAEAPRDCAGIKALAPATRTLRDERYAVYFAGALDKPFDVDCQNMSSAAALTYLPINPSYVNDDIYNDSQPLKYNYSASVTATAKQSRTFKKYRLIADASGLAIDTGDTTHSNLYNPGNKVPPGYTADAGFSMRGGNVSTNIDLSGTGLALAKGNVFKVHGSGPAPWPYVNYSYYDDPGKTDPGKTGKHVVAMTGTFNGDPAWMAVGSQPAHLALEYVPSAVMTNNTPKSSSDKNLPVAAAPWNKDRWCNAFSAGPYTCPNALQLLFTIASIL